MKARSLYRVLTGGVLVANLLCSVSFSAVAILHEMHGRRRAFDVMLRGRADSVLGAVGNAKPQRAAPASSGDFFEVLNPTGVVLARSRNVTPDLERLMTRPSDREYLDFTWDRKAYRALRLHSVESTTDSRTALTVIYAASTEDLRHEAAEAAMFYFKVSASFLLALIVLTTWFLRARLAPLKDLAVRAGLVSTDSWHFEIPPAALDTAELRPIATSIKDLLNRLKMAFDRQRQFTGDAAHELKTSIAVLKTRLQLLSMRQRSVKEYERGVEELLFDLHRMEDLTAAMLTLARVEDSGTGSMQTIDLSAVVHSMAEYLQPIATIKGVTIQLLAEDVSPVRMYGNDAEILCSNLMTNALQHSPEHSTMTVSIRSTGHSVELRVSDCGEGIPEASLEQIFERFFRVDSSRSRQTGGAGLGLAICKAIADRSMASIVLTSQLGRGTDVLVTFPRQNPDAG